MARQRRRINLGTTYPRPDTPSTELTTIPRNFIANKQPPPSTPPQLPPLQRDSPLPGFKLSRHVVPGAYPRSMEDSVVPEGQTLPRDAMPFGKVGGATKEERKASARAAGIKALEMREACKYRFAAMPGVVEQPMWTAANRFVKDKPSEKGVTLVCLHANGFHKELWEETLRRLVELEKQMGVQDGVDEVWAMDIWNHGESYALNEGKVTAVSDWLDIGRDVLSLLENALQGNANPSQALPTVLKWHEMPYKSEKRNGQRRTIGVGHSIGGNGIEQAAHARPWLFDQLILIDPMTRPVGDIDRMWPVGLTASSVGRVDTWPSRQAARQALLKSPFFSSWHPAVFDNLIRFGLVTVDPPPRAASDGESEADSGPVTLATPRWAETAMFSTGDGPQGGYDKLEHLRGDLPVHFIMAGTDNASATGGPERTRRIVWKPNMASNVIVNSGHLITQQRPDILAVEMFKALHPGVSVPAASEPEKATAKL